MEVVCDGLVEVGMYHHEARMRAVIAQIFSSTNRTTASVAQRQTPQCRPQRKPLLRSWTAGPGPSTSNM